jgi:hypothetical protein
VGWARNGCSGLQSHRSYTDRDGRKCSGCPGESPSRLKAGATGYPEAAVSTRHDGVTSNRIVFIT